MGIVKRAADLTYSFRFIRMIVMDWKNWDAYKLGLIDENGKRVKSVKIDDDQKKSAYTPFIRLCANVKRLISKIPGGGTKLGSFASALFLMKEQFGVQDKTIRRLLELNNLSTLDFLNENSQWFILENNQISPGVYKVKGPKVINKNFEEVIYANDQIRIHDNCFPVGDVFGLNIYEATHLKTNQNIYITISEIYK